MSAFAMAAAALALLLPAALDDLFVAPAQLTLSAWAAIAFIGLSSGGFYVLWLWALKTIAATRVTVFLAFSPVTAAVLGVVLLGEPVTADDRGRGRGALGGEWGGVTQSPPHT